MRDHIEKKIYHVEILPPKQNTKDLEKGLNRFASKYQKVMDAGYMACITDNAMGNLSFQGTEMIEELELPVHPEQVMIHLNTFHTKEDLDEILTYCIDSGIKYLLIVSGDGSDRLPKLSPADVGSQDVESVTSVELLKYIRREYPGKFNMGVAFNPYEPEEHEFEKMDRKLEAGAEFIITQPILEEHPLVEKLMKKRDIPIIVEAWMSKKLHLLSDAVGYEIPEDTAYDPIETLKILHKNYPECGVYLALLGFKTQFPKLSQIW
jgi:methylenetetrahydrofolate reductase (NADPH)